jgi:hypothetical protein
MVMRTDVNAAGPGLGATNAADATREAGVPHPLAQHPAVVGAAAHAGMRHLSVTGQQSCHVDPASVFAELQDEGPTARAPR